MVNQTGPTEGQSQGQNNMSSGVYKKPYPGENNQDGTDLTAHDDWVTQGFADGHITVNSHENKDKIFMQPNRWRAKTCVIHSL